MPPTMKLPTLCGRSELFFPYAVLIKNNLPPENRPFIGACEMGTGSIRSLYSNTVLFVHCLVWKKISSWMWLLEMKLIYFSIGVKKSPYIVTHYVHRSKKRQVHLLFKASHMMNFTYVSNIRTGIPLWDGNRRNAPNLN